MKPPALVLVRLFLLILTALLLWGCSAESKRARTLERAAEFYKSGDRERARIEYLNVLQSDPDNLAANERLALIWLDRGSPTRAAGYLTKLKGVAPGIFELRLKLAQIVLSLGNATEARNEANLILARSATFEEALVLLTECIRSPGDFKEAEQVLQRMTDKNSVHHLIASANMMILRGDGPAAKALLQRAVARDPKSVDARLAYATWLTVQGNPTEAAVEFKQAAELAPVNSMARLKYGLSLAQTGGIEPAIAYLTAMTQQAPDYLPALRTLAQLAISTKKFDEAQKRVQDIFAQEPLDLEGRLLRARLRLAQGQTKEAIEELEKFGTDFPGLGVEKHQLGLAYLQANDQPNAIKALQEAVGRNPDNLEAAVLLAQLNLRNGAPQPAAYAMAEMVSRRPNLMQAYPVLIDATRALGRIEQAAAVIGQSIKMSPKNAQLYLLFGAVMGQMQKPAEARLSFEQVLELAPYDPSAVAELVALDLKENKPADALKRAQALAIQAPNSALAHFLEARVHARQQAWNKAETAALKALELDGRQPGVYGLLAESYAARKSDPAIRSRIESLLSKRPDDELAAIAGGQFFAETNDPAKARDVYTKLLAAKPNASAILNNLASLYDEKLNQSDLALDVARKARQLEPGSPVIADTLGWILYRRKEYPEAATLLIESAKGMPNHPEVHYHLGMVQKALGKNDEAVAAFRAAANHAAEFSGKEDAKRQLALLEQGRR